MHTRVSIPVSLTAHQLSCRWLKARSLPCRPRHAVATHTGRKKLPTSVMTHLVRHHSCESTCCECGSCTPCGLQEQCCAAETMLGGPQYHSPAIHSRLISCVWCRGGTCHCALHDMPLVRNWMGKCRGGRTVLHSIILSKFMLWPKLPLDADSLYMTQTLTEAHIGTAACRRDDRVRA